MSEQQDQQPQQWTMPEWMEPLAELFTNLGRPPSREAIEELHNGRTNLGINGPLAAIEMMAIAQAHLLHKLRDAGLLRLPDAPDAADLFERRWHCDVVASGYDVSPCAPEDRHGPANRASCGYRWIAPPLTDEEMKDYRPQRD